MTVPLLFCTGGVVSPPAAHAQFLTPRSLLSGVHSQDTAENKILRGVNPLSVFAAPGKATLGLRSNETSGVFVAASAGQTVQTIKNGVHTGDLWGTGQTVFLTYISPRHTLRGDVFYQENKQAGLSAQPEKNRRTDAHINTSQAAFRLTTRLFNQPSWDGFVGFDTVHSDANANSTAFLHLLPLFNDTTPSAQVTIQERETAAGVCWHQANVFVFGAAGRFDAPGSGQLLETNTETQVKLPLNANGSLWSVGGSVGFHGEQGEVSAFLSGKSARGTGSVTQTGNQQTTTLGEGHTHQNERTGGVAASWKARNSRLTVSYSRTTGVFETFGGGLLAQPLGFSSDNVTRVGYFVHADVLREDTGVGWEKETGRRQSAAVSLHYVRLPFGADYGYSGRLFLVSYGEGETFREPSARGFALHARYDVPLGRGKESRNRKNFPRLVLEADQIIPLPLVRPKSTENPLPPPPPSSSGTTFRTRTRGGWSLSAGMAFPL